MIGTGELIVIFCVILVLFGGKKLPELARSIGLGIREFKKACQGLEEEKYEHHMENRPIERKEESSECEKVERKDP